MTPLRLSNFRHFNIIFPSLLMLLFLLNALSTFLRYSEPYKIVLPSFLHGILHPRSWTKSWKYTSLLEGLPSTQQDKQTILVYGKTFDVFEYEFLLLPRSTQGVQNTADCRHFLMNHQQPRPFVIIDHRLSTTAYPCEQTFLKQYHSKVVTSNFTLWVPR